MTSLIPRQPYSQAELDTLYPKQLKLHQVQILLRHGERTPVNPRFQKTGLPPYWSYCNAARHLTSPILNTKNLAIWGNLQYQRSLETVDEDDDPVIATSPRSDANGICQPGELTDRGRETTLALGERLRHLYIEQLGFMPSKIASADSIYLRSTPIPRALESLQQAFTGFYPPSTRLATFPPPTVVIRTPTDETLYPNDASCRRFAQLSRAFAQRAAHAWNDTEDMQYLSSIFSKYMPDKGKVAVDSHPRLSGIMDTVNATDAHGPDTKLPAVFYDAKARDIIDKIVTEEWFRGYSESTEYRALGIGALMGDITSRMVKSTVPAGSQTPVKLGLSGCHDTTLAAILTSLGAFDGERWPPFTSHIVFELFRARHKAGDGERQSNASRFPNWWSSLLGLGQSDAGQSLLTVARRPLAGYTASQRQELESYYVRIRYNDKIMQVPGCKTAGKHLDGDTTFCTLEAFKDIVDKYTPKNWKSACTSRIDKPAFPVVEEPAGYP